MKIDKPFHNHYIYLPQMLGHLNPLVTTIYTLVLDIYIYNTS
jgi:hypothetical protein